MANGLKVVAVRHPMPYGDLAAQRVQRFARISDLAKHDCTVEEMEEYEPHVVRGNVIYAGVDYEAILRCAENDPAGCDVIVWDGGNNDFPFYRPDLHVTVVDPHRPGHEMRYYPGNVTLRLADVVVINKIDSAAPEGVDTVRRNIAAVNPNAVVVDAASVLDVDDAAVIRGQEGAGGGRRAHADPWRDEDRGGRGGRPQVRGRGPRRPQAVSIGQPEGDVSGLPRHRDPAAGHGVRGRAAEGPRAHDQPYALRRGGGRHADRPEPHHPHQAPEHPGPLPPAGDRHAGPPDGARALRRTPQTRRRRAARR